MTATVDLITLEPKLKEILYRCLEDIRATKAALYLANGEAHFDLVTQYGFREVERKQIDARDDFIDRLVIKRTPFFVNSLTEDPRLSQTLFSAGTTRMLLAPIYGRGKLIGFLDMRDKAAKQPFGPGDITSAQKITEQFLDLFAEQNLFGQRSAPSTPSPQFSSPRPVLEMPTQPSTANMHVDEAKRAVARGVLRNRTAVETLTPLQIEAGAVVLPAVIGLPGVLFAALSSFGRFGGHQRVASHGDLTADAAQKFEMKLKGWLQKRGEPEGLTESSIFFPLGKAPRAIDASRITTVMSAPVELPQPRAVVLTVAFEAPPTAHIRSLLAGLLRQCTEVVNFAVSAELLTAVNYRVAEKLVEPDLQRYPVLSAHSRRVSDHATRLARAAGLNVDQIETARIAGLVHDVGMRLLDYEILYRKPTLTNEDLRMLKEHPIVGAAIVAESPLGGEVAHIVLCHHERPDGTGYPHGLTGESIPIISRIIHICEAYDAMTASDSYQTPVPPAAALARIRRVGGAQLDEELAVKFVEMLSSPHGSGS
ncbi:MAG: HD domain-containing phosphohydrolase [Acidobacteriota bacterium]